jgi:cytochrome c biogenesis protein CcmG, thiol:disulfide interchange protein DsbE
MEYTNEPNSPPKRSIGPTLVVVAVAAILAIAWMKYFRPQMQLDDAQHQAGVGMPLMTLELQPLTGTTDGVSLENLRGKVALVNYWGPWCGFCVQEFPHLVELWDRNRGNPEFAFVSVSSSGRSDENVPQLKRETEAFMNVRGATFPTYVDPDGANRQLLGSIMGGGGFGYPTTILLDRKGIIRAVWFGYQSGYEHQMEQLVSKLLADKEPEKKTTNNNQEG